MWAVMTSQCRECYRTKCPGLASNGTRQRYKKAFFSRLSAFFHHVVLRCFKNFMTRPVDNSFFSFLMRAQRQIPLGMIAMGHCFAAGFGAGTGQVGHKTGTVNKGPD